MALDVPKPKGYRRAWNGGKKPEETPETRRFHLHVENCGVCNIGMLQFCAAARELLERATNPTDAPR